MYSIIQLNDRNLSELQTVVQELDIKKTDSLKEEGLIYKILGEQVIAGVTKKVAADGLKEERKEDKKKRSQVTVKRENTNKIFSSAKNGKLTKTNANTPTTKAQAKTTEPIKEATKKMSTETSTTPTGSTEATSYTTPKKKLGHPRKDVVETETKPTEATADRPVMTPAVWEEKPVAQPEAEKRPISKPVFKSKPTVVNEESSIPSGADADSDFTPIEDLPSEEVELPTELFGKFESTRTEPAITTPKPAAQPQRPRVIRPCDNNNYSNNDNSQCNNNQRPPAQRCPVPQRNTTEPVPVQERRVIRHEKPCESDDILTGTGILGIIQGDYGFFRSSDYNYPSPLDDIYVSQSQTKLFGLKTGDVVEGAIRPPEEGEKYFPLTKVSKINGRDAAFIRDRVSFDHLTPLFPDEKFEFCKGGYPDSMLARVIDLSSPIDKGRRIPVVAQPKTGRTILMKETANVIATNHPEVYMIMLLIDERPEGVADMARSVNAEVIASTFNEPAERHIKIAGTVPEKAKRPVKCGHDVVIFLDSTTRPARAYNTVSPTPGKVLSGGMDVNALHKPKRFFGVARNIENGGSLTVIATALIDTSSKMDEVISEEFRGISNMELRLDHNLSNKRISSTVNIVASSTHCDDLLLDKQTLDRMWILRKYPSGMNPIEVMDFVKDRLGKAKDNDGFLISMNS